MQFEQVIYSVTDQPRKAGQEDVRRANGVYKKMLNEYEAPPLDQGIDEALNAFITNIKDSMPDALE